MIRETVLAAWRSVSLLLALLAALLSSGAQRLDGQATDATVFSGVASAGGANGTQWRSEATVTNPGASAVTALLEIVPLGQTSVLASKTLSLGPGETQHFGDLYAAMGITGGGSGTLRLTGDAVAWVRTYNQGTNGTFGTDVPAVTYQTAFDPSQQVFFPINTPADQAKDFRSNLLLTNMEDGTVTFFLGSGATFKSVDVPAGQFLQISGIGPWMGLAPGGAILSVTTNGRWTGIVTTIDPILGDPTTVRGLVAKARNVTLFPGVASASGYNGTQWRSEATIFNPKFSQASVQLELMPRGGSTVAASTTVSVGPYQTLKIPDVYAKLGASSGAGTLRVTGNVLTWVRTFNQGAATFGTDVPEVIQGSGNGPEAVVVFPLSSPASIGTDFRSNFLVYNHETRAITCTLASGNAKGTVQVPAGAFVQQDNLGDFLGLPPGTATVQVTADGRWSGMVSTIDPYLGDPTTMVGLLLTGNPTPTAVGTAEGAEATATIGPSGGTLTSADGVATLTVPAGALATPTVLKIQAVTNLAWGGVGSGYAVGPLGTRFSSPATLTMKAVVTDVDGTSVEGRGISLQDPDGYWRWQATTVDPAAGTISVAIAEIARNPSSSNPRPETNIDGKPYVQNEGVRLTPSWSMLKPDGRLGLTVESCVHRFPKGAVNVPCYTSRSGTRYSAKDWQVNQIPDGNDSVGTVTGGPTYALYEAPGSIPQPSTVKVTASVANWEQVTPAPPTLSARIKIGGNMEGGFSLTQLGTAWTLKVTGQTRLTMFEAGNRIYGWHMTGTVTAPREVEYKGNTCNLASAATLPIPTDTNWESAIVNRKKSQRWSMKGLKWRYTCSIGPLDLGIDFVMASGTNCSDIAWVTLDNDDSPSGTFPMDCPGGRVNGEWNFFGTR
jgi:hypothetical protein